MTRPTDGLPPAGRTNRGEVPSPGTPARAAEISVRGGGARERGAPGFLIRFSCVRYLQMLRTLKKRGKHLNRRTLAYFSLLGLTGIALSMPILQLSILYAGSGVAAVLFSCNPVFVTFLAFFLLGEPIRPRHIAALLLEVAGTVAIISPWNTRLSMTGVALALLSTLLFSVYGVMGKRKCAEYGGVVVTCFSFLFGSLITLALILLTHIPAVASALTAAGLSSFANIPILAGYTLQNLPCVLYVSAGVAGIGFCAYFLAMESQPASVVSLVYFFKTALSLSWLCGSTVKPSPSIWGQALFSSWRGPCAPSSREFWKPKASSSGHNQAAAAPGAPVGRKRKQPAR